MLTLERAKEVHKAQSQFPSWGNYTKFMTHAEIEHVEWLFQNAKSGNVSVASIVMSIAVGREIELAPGVEPRYVT